MNETAVLQLRNVTKKIGRRTIVDHLSFDVPRGEVFGFLGPNGAGKTTTIRMIVGLIGMSDGEVYVQGIPVKKEFENAMRHVGAIVENPEMYKFLTGYQNLVHYARMHSGVTKQRIQEVVELVGLKNRIHEKVKKYSLGMRQRLGVAQAILHKPSVLILDEPTNGLDPAGIRELRDYLRRLAREEGIAIVVSSHLLSEMELMCDRVAIIQNGKLIDVQSLHDAKTVEQRRVTIETDDPLRAKETLESVLSVTDVAVREGEIELLADREQIAVITEMLVHAGSKIYGIRSASKSLEDQFLEMTGSEQIV
ncbi:MULTISPECIES: ABC transporter ATP-binding protein [unclassified Paenibacillus]|uniref:ABC transporter ATP-binding protein n=1 Tax=unclassified Paenibacillus TaxID=185978 RepID=UPI001C103289|nr:MULTISPECIES: ABC transporter ATP-binding protein [unclassified Paenibacillus]MBU5442304.1 ABC transporter ATP-binding protein [Paenibacillus sp. MSJ-34]CAH0121247.1 Bacitracin transport ATP-binding protein BcrA [Paenibacillus sp. CECT 9249]